MYVKKNFSWRDIIHTRNQSRMTTLKRRVEIFQALTKTSAN